MAFARCINVEKAVIENCGTVVSKTAFAYVPNLQPTCVATAFFTNVVLLDSVHFDIMKLAVVSIFIYKTTDFYLCDVFAVIVKYIE